MSEEQGLGGGDSLDEVIGIDVAIPEGAGAAVKALADALRSLDTNLTALEGRDLGAWSSKFVASQTAMQESIATTNKLLLAQRELMATPAPATPTPMATTSIAARLGRDEGGVYSSAAATASLEERALQRSMRQRLSRDTGEWYSDSGAYSQIPYERSDRLLRDAVDRIYRHAPRPARDVMDWSDIYGVRQSDIGGALGRFSVGNTKNIIEVATDSDVGKPSRWTLNSHYDDIRKYVRGDDYASYLGTRARGIEAVTAHEIGHGVVRNNIEYDEVERVGGLVRNTLASSGTQFPKGWSDGRLGHEVLAETISARLTGAPLSDQLTVPFVADQALYGDRVAQIRYAERLKQKRLNRIKTQSGSESFYSDSPTAIPEGAVRYTTDEAWPNSWGKRTINGEDWLIPPDPSTQIQRAEHQVQRVTQASATGRKQLIDDMPVNMTLSSDELDARAAIRVPGQAGISLDHEVRARQMADRAEAITQTEPTAPKRTRRTKAEIQAAEQRKIQELRDESALFAEAINKKYSKPSSTRALKPPTGGVFPLPEDLGWDPNARQGIYPTPLTAPQVSPTVPPPGRVPTVPPHPSPQLLPGGSAAVPPFGSRTTPPSAWSPNPATQNVPWTPPPTPPGGGHVPPINPPPASQSAQPLSRPNLTDRMLYNKYGIMRNSWQFQDLMPDIQETLLNDVMTGYSPQGVLEANRNLTRIGGRRWEDWSLTRNEQALIQRTRGQNVLSQVYSGNAGTAYGANFIEQMGGYSAAERMGFSANEWQTLRTRAPEWTARHGQRALASVEETDVMRAFADGTITAAQRTELLDARMAAASRTGSGLSRVFNGLEFSMLRSVMVMGVMWGVLNTTGQAVAALTDNFMKLDKAAAISSYASGRSQSETRVAAMHAIVTGAQYGQGPTESINAYVQASRYTKDIPQQNQLVDTSAKMAVMTGGDQATMMKELITITRQWGLTTAETTKVLDVSAAAVKHTNVDLSDFIRSMAQGAIVGKEMGWTLEQTAGMYAGFLQISGKGASEASSFFEKLTTVGSRPVDLKQLNDIGIFTRDANGELLKTSQILDQLSAKWKGMSDGDRRIASDAMAGQRQLDNFLALINNYPTLLNYQKQFSNQVGEGDRAITTMMNNLSDQAARVFPSIGALVTAAFTPSSDVQAWWTNFFKGIADSSNTLAAVANAQRATPGLEYTKDSVFNAAAYQAMGRQDLADQEINAARAKAQQIDSSQYRLYGGKHALELESYEKLLRENETPRGASEDQILAEVKRYADERGWVGNVTPVGSTNTPGISSDTYLRQMNKNRASGVPTGSTPPSTVGWGNEQKPWKLGLPDMTKYTSADVDSIARIADNLSQKYLASIAPLDKNLEYTKKIKEEWANTAITIGLADGSLKTMTGSAAALWSQSSKIFETYQKPSIQSMPELNQNTAPRLQQYIKQYEGLLGRLGVKQDPQQYMMFGQGGQLYKYYTSSEAMTLAMDLLREEIKTNTQEQGKLRGHYNIPTAFGYKPPTVWEYYSQTGAHDMGPVNYPWMFDKAGPTDKNGKPLLGSVPNGVTKEFDSGFFGKHVDTFGAAVTQFAATVKPTVSPNVSPNKNEDYGIRHPDVRPSSSLPSVSTPGFDSTGTDAPSRFGRQGAPMYPQDTPTEAFERNVFSQYGFTPEAQSIIGKIPLKFGALDDPNAAGRYSFDPNALDQPLRGTELLELKDQNAQVAVHEFAHAYYDNKFTDEQKSAFDEASRQTNFADAGKLDTDERYAHIASVVMGDTGKLPTSLRQFYSGMFTGNTNTSGVATSPSLANQGGMPGSLVGMADRFSEQYGMTDKGVLRAIIQAESQWNPNAVGDKGASIGLLQNHMRGGRGTGYTKAQLLDPGFNVRLGMPEIAKWYKQGEAQGLHGADLAKYVGQHAQRPAAGMEQNYATAYHRGLSQPANNALLAQVGGGRGLQIQGITQTNSTLTSIHSANRSMMTNTASLPRMAASLATIALSSSQQIALLARIAAGIAALGTARGAQSPSLSSRAGVSMSGAMGANASGWRQ